MKARIIGLLAAVLFVSTGISSFTVTAAATPAGGGCLLVANSEVWLNVWELTGNNQKGQVIFKDLHLGENGTQQVRPVPGDRIIYNSKVDAYGQYARDTISPCENGDRVVVP